jgi:hypothetical protein
VNQLAGFTWAGKHQSPLRDHMALLIIGLDKHIGPANVWREVLKEQLPHVEVRIWPAAGDVADIEYLAFMHPDSAPCPPSPI